MIVAIDVHYRTNFAKSVSVEFKNWTDAKPDKINIQQVDDVEEYIPGEFYKRELPCILEVLKLTPLKSIDLIIIDGYVILNDEDKAGLGMYLYKTLNKQIPIIGVAKTSFKNNSKKVKEIFRGESKKPLFISSVGIDLDLAARNITNMHGSYRMPDLLSILDQNTKA